MHYYQLVIVAKPDPFAPAKEFLSAYPAEEKEMALKAGRAVLAAQRKGYLREDWHIAVRRIEVQNGDSWIADATLICETE